VSLAGLLLCAVALAGPRVIPAAAVDADEAEALFRGRRLALLVGPESFGTGGYSDLRYAAADVGALEELLLDPGRGHFDEVISLTDPAQASRAGVMRAMTQLEERVVSADDTVFVYFSTHGTLARGHGDQLDQYLVLADTRLDDVRGTGLAHDEVLAWLERLPSRRKVLLLATCHSGQGKSVLSPDMSEAMEGAKGLPAVPPLREVSEAVVVIGVCAWNEVARESPELGHDIYTHFFLEALGEADKDGDGAVTVTEAHDHARAATWDFTGGAQRAYARAEITGADPVVLAGERSQQGQGLLASYQESLAGLVVYIDGLVKGELPGQVVVPPGQHMVTLEDPQGRVVARQRLSLDQGERLDADRLLHRDHVRLGTGLGFSAIADPMPWGPMGHAELHLPRFPGKGWETILHGAAMARWPRPVLEGGITIEHPIRYGTWQIRGGLDLHGYLLQGDTDGRWFTDEPDGGPQLLAPSMAPQPVLSFCWLPGYPAMARLALSGGYLWWTDSGSWHHAWSGNLSFVVGGRF
jgi:hypothetical protein